ncbi:uncharacterized protein LOC135367921 [Ornithodoros turicata]|uniref:uncharacterized protein LOC135367921 n=1 Tax=Ornithodoros turicata TaxID=34597 RepID=UPI00313A494D
MASLLQANLSAATDLVAALGIKDDYMNTVHGSLNFLETAIASVLFVAVNLLSFGSLQFGLLNMLSFAYAVHGLHLLLCGVLSKIFPFNIIHTIYYTVFNYAAAFSYLVAALHSLSVGGLLKAVTSLVITGLAVACALVHLCHAIYSKKHLTGT